MATTRRVTLRAQWLGQMLRDLRDNSGLTLKDAGEYLQKDLSTVSKFELGTFPVRRGDLSALLDLYGVDDKRQRETLHELCGEVWQSGWWDKYSADDVWGSTIDYVWLEGRTHAIRSFATLSVPGLLQTADYTRALIRTVNVDESEGRIGRWVELRLARQAILEQEDAPDLTVLLDEAALRRPVGGRKVMADQVRHLIELTERPGIDIRVLPFDTGAHASPEGAFTLLDLPEPFSTIAHIESPGGAIYLERNDVHRLVRLYDRLQEACLSPQESAAFLAAVEKDLR